MVTCHCHLWWRWWFVTLWTTFMRLWLHSLSCYLKLLLWRFLCNFIKHFQMFCAFSIHLFLGFKVYPRMQSIGPIIHYSSCPTWFLVFICAFIFFTFPPSLYLRDLVSLLLLVSWLEFLPLCFFQLHFRVYLYLPSNTFSIFIYFSLHFSPCIYHYKEKANMWPSHLQLPATIWSL